MGKNTYTTEGLDHLGIVAGVFNRIGNTFCYRGILAGTSFLRVRDEAGARMKPPTGGKAGSNHRIRALNSGAHGGASGVTRPPGDRLLQ